MKYMYKCKWCGKRKEIERKAMEEVKPIFCDCLNRPQMNRDYLAENKGVVIPAGMRAV